MNAPLPNFSGKSTLSLRDLDTLSGHLRALETKPRTPVKGERGRWQNLTPANFGSSYSVNIDAFTQEGGELIKDPSNVDNMGLIERNRPELYREVLNEINDPWAITGGEARFPLAHNPLEPPSNIDGQGGTWKSEIDCSPYGKTTPLDDYILSGEVVPGLIAAVETGDKLELWHGVLTIPTNDFCNFNNPLQGSDIDGSTVDDVVGIIKSIRADLSNVDEEPSEEETSAVESFWRIEQGEIIVPMACRWCSDSTVDHEGLINEILPALSADETASGIELPNGAERWMIEHGRATIPYANSQNYPSSFTSTIEQGGIVRRISPENPEESDIECFWKIVEGDIVLPLSRYGLVEGEVSAVDVAGIISSIIPEPATSNVEEGEETPAGWTIDRGKIVVGLADTSTSTAGIVNSIMAFGAESGSSVENQEPWSIVKGCISVPMCSTSDEGEGIVGVIRGIALVDSSEVPSVSDGVIRIPSGATAEITPLAEYNSTLASDVKGVIAAIQQVSSSEPFRIEGGKIKIPETPLAIFNAGEGEEQGDKQGLIKGIHEDPELTEYKIVDGVIKIPTASKVDAKEYAACEFNSGKGSITGLIESIAIVDGGELMIDSGAIKIPKTLIGETSNIDYQFDSTYFIVNGTTVSLNVNAINDIVAEAAEEIEVNVTASGVIQNDGYGNLNFSTSTTSAALETLAFDSYISR